MSTKSVSTCTSADAAAAGAGWSFAAAADLGGWVERGIRCWNLRGEEEARRADARDIPDAGQCHDAGVHHSVRARATRAYAVPGRGHDIVEPELGRRRRGLSPKV